MKVRVNGDNYWFFCPGCDGPIRINKLWTFNGDLDKPTFSPSILSRSSVMCHSFITDGMIRFLPDSTHPLAGQTVELPELPDWLVD